MCLLRRSPRLRKAPAEEPAPEEPPTEPEVVEESVAEEPPAEPEVPEEPAVEDTPAEEAPPTEEAPPEEPAVEMPVSQMFEITLTNLTTGEPGTGGQVLSPPIFVTHAAGINLAAVGQPASPALVLLAENGDTSGLVALAAAAGANAMPTADVVPPGGSATVTVTADMVNSSLSVGSMLVSTNDAFIAATDVPLFDENGAPVSASIDLNAYDAGSEENTEMASDIPGPVGLDEAADPPGSNARVPTEGGVIAPHEGIQGVGDVGEAFAWEEPTAMLTITPVEAPAEPVVEEPMPEPVVYGFDVTLETRLEHDFYSVDASRTVYGEIVGRNARCDNCHPLGCCGRRVSLVTRLLTKAMASVLMASQGYIVINTASRSDGEVHR